MNLQRVGGADVSVAAGDFLSIRSEEAVLLAKGEPRREMLDLDAAAAVVAYVVGAWIAPLT
jgi:hypothetical protein